MDDLYSEYGRLMLEAELINVRINNVKSRIVEEIKKQQQLRQQTQPPKPTDAGDVSKVDKPTVDK